MPEAAEDDLSGALHSIGGFCARRAPWVIGAWVIVVVALVLVANSVGRETNNDLTLPGTGSQQATDLLESGLPTAANGTVPIVIHTDTGTLTSGSNATAIDDTVKSLEKNQYVSSVINPLSQQAESTSVSKDGKTAYISVALNVSSGDLNEEEAQNVFDAAEPARKAGLEVQAGGYLGQTLSTPSTRASEVVGVVAAIIVLLFAFARFAPVPLPITTAIVALLAGLAVVGLVGHAFDVPSIAPTLGVMLGLGVGVDYSLFIVNRHQAFLRRGIGVEESIARSVATSGTAVVFAGSTVILALLCLYFSGLPIVRSLGYATAIVVAVVVVAAITLLPALLGLLGERIHALRVPFLRGEREFDPDNPKGLAPAALIGRRSLVGSLLGIAILVVIAVPARNMTLGAPDFGQLPESTTERQAYDLLTANFGVGTNGPLLIACSLDPAAQPDPSAIPQVQQQEAAGQITPQQAQQQEQILQTPAGDPRITSLQQDIAKQKGVASVTPAQVSKDGKTAVFSAVPTTSPSAEATQNLVNHLRDETIPNATKGQGITAYVGGTTAGYIDLADKISQKLVIVIAIVVVLSALLLTVAFRTVVIPILSALLNLLAIVAAYGVLTWVFEDGNLISLIGVDHATPVVSYVPLMMFAILFGLSMDYQVFLLSRVSESFRAGKDNHAAVIEGLGRSARVIATAATIMTAVFFSFVLNGDPIVKQFGVGLAVAVVIDALVVLLIAPGLIILIGRRAWYLPGWIGHILPDLGVEGSERYK